MLKQPLPVHPGRRVYRGLKEPTFHRLDVTWGSASQIEVTAGSVISVTSVDGTGHAILTTLGADKQAFSVSALDVPQNMAQPIDVAAFDSRHLAALAANRDGLLDDGLGYSIFGDASQPGDSFVTRVTANILLFLIAPITKDFVEAGGGSRFTLTVKPPDTASQQTLLPSPLGKVRDEWRVGRGSAKAYELKKGQFVQVIDVEGQQCSDFMAMRASALDAGLERFIDSTVSRTKARSAYPLPGLHDKFYDQDIRPLLSVRQDTVGRHDTFALACTAEGYEERGFPGHLNCSDNISDAFEPFGIARRRAWPAINFFFNSWIDWQQHGITADEAWSRPGDYVVMQALTDLVCVSTACPDDVDPINGWNPTDIHVRIYEESTSISHSVTWRAQPEDEGRLTQHTAFHPRTSSLTSSFQVARNLWMPTHYDATGAVGEYWACRNAATLQDMSGLRKFDVVGPDAEELLQVCLTRDVSRLAQHRGLYALVCDERGAVLDDGTLFRLEPTAFRWCCGSDDSGLHLREQAEARGLNVAVRSLGDKMVNLALQGPKSRNILRSVITTQLSRPALDNLKWFGFTIARLGGSQGPAIMLCRSGFTGELGYEIFCDQSHALEVWDRLTEAGADAGLVPMGSEALNMLRIEAGLMISAAEFGSDVDALESGLGFAVDFKKADFVGKTALARNASAERRRLVGLRMTGNEVPHHGDGVFVGREQVGTVTSGCFSPQLGHAIAMARVAIETSAPDTVLEVGKLDGHMKRLPAHVSALPFLDSNREKARA